MKNVWFVYFLKSWIKKDFKYLGNFSVFCEGICFCLVYRKKKIIPTYFPNKFSFPNHYIYFSSLKDLYKSTLNIPNKL